LPQPSSNPTKIISAAAASHEPAEVALEPLQLGIDIPARIAQIDQTKLERWRLDRLRQQLVDRDFAGALLSDPMNIRYATGTRNMSVWTAHAPGRYVFVSTDGPVVLFEFGSSRHVSAQAALVDEQRPSTPWFYFLAGPRGAQKAKIWADEIADLLRSHGGGNMRLAVDRCDPMGANGLIARGVELHDAQEVCELARSIKSAEEIACLQLSMDVCDLGVERMRMALRPGLTENQLWSVLHQTNIAHDGEWIECRLLASGQRTNPWFQECGTRVIQAGDLVAFDTDMVGPTGYLADISRSWVCPGITPSGKQRRLYDLAQQQIVTNVELLRPGLSFREFGERCWPVPEAFVANRYMMMVHGVGMVDEYPVIAYAKDFNDWGFDGVLQENMVVSVESYLGAVGDTEGVKLEQQVLITANGAIPMSRSPFIDALAI